MSNNPMQPSGAAFPHPLPRRYGTGVPALGQIARARARGWRAVAHCLGPWDAQMRDWSREVAAEEFEAALGWRQGEEESFAQLIAALALWAAGSGARLDARQEARIARACRPDAELAQRARTLGERTLHEAELWEAGDLPAARSLRSEVSAQLESFADALDERGLRESAPYPLRVLDRLSLIFADAEAGRPTLKHL